MKIVLAIIVLLVLKGCFDGAIESKDRQVPRAKIEYQLKTYFQERFIKLECAGNRETVKIINNKPVPREIDITFKAKVRIDGKIKTIVGGMTGLAGMTIGGFGNWTSDPYIAFTISLKNDWHFVNEDESTAYYCLGDNFSAAKLLSISKHKKPFKFNSHNTDFNVQRYWNEIRIAEKMCNDGDEKYCSYYNDYMRSKERTTHNSSTNRKKIYNSFRNRYYKRLCERNISKACENLESVYN